MKGSQAFVLLQECVEDSVEVAAEVARLVEREDGLRNHVLDLTDS